MAFKEGGTSPLAGGVQVQQLGAMQEPIPDLKIVHGHFQFGPSPKFPRFLVWIASLINSACWPGQFSLAWYSVTNKADSHAEENLRVLTHRVTRICSLGCLKV